MRLLLLRHLRDLGGVPVNRFLLEGLRRSGAVVEECREELWEDGFLHAAIGRQGAGRLWRVARRLPGVYRRLADRYRRQAEHRCVIVGYPGLPRRGPGPVSSCAALPPAGAWWPSSRSTIPW